MPQRYLDIAKLPKHLQFSVGSTKGGLTPYAEFAGEQEFGDTPEASFDALHERLTERVELKNKVMPEAPLGIVLQVPVMIDAHPEEADVDWIVSRAPSGACLVQIGDTYSADTDPQKAWDDALGKFLKSAKEYQHPQEDVPVTIPGVDGPTEVSREQVIRMLTDFNISSNLRYAEQEKEFDAMIDAAEHGTSGMRFWSNEKLEKTFDEIAEFYFEMAEAGTLRLNSYDDLPEAAPAPA